MARTRLTQSEEKRSSMRHAEHMLGADLSKPRTWNRSDEGQNKLEVRGDRSRLIVSEFFEWLEEELAASAVYPSNPLTETVSYARDPRVGREVFPDNPDLPIDTNHLERTLRFAADRNTSAVERR